MINLSDNQLASIDLHQIKPFGKKYTGDPVSRLGSEHQWTHDLTNWLDIIENWEKESQLILKLAGLTTLGQERTPALDSCITHLTNLFQTDIEELKKELFALAYRTEKMAPNKRHYERQIQECKRQMYEVANHYNRLKYKFLEEISHSIPVTII